MNGPIGLTLRSHGNSLAVSAGTIVHLVTPVDDLKAELLTVPHSDDDRFDRRLVGLPAARCRRRNLRLLRFLQRERRSTSVRVVPPSPTVWSVTTHSALQALRAEGWRVLEQRFPRNPQVPL